MSSVYALRLRIATPFPNKFVSGQQRKYAIDYLHTNHEGNKMFKRRQSDQKPLLSPAFVTFVASLSHLEPVQRVELEDKRAESIQEYFRNRSSK